MRATVRVDGLQECIRAARRAGASAADLKQAWQPIGSLAVSKAKQIAPYREKDGWARKRRRKHVRDTVRASRLQNGVIVRAGGAAAPHAPYVVFGSEHNPRKFPFLDMAAQSLVPQMEFLLSVAMKRALESAGVDVT